MKYLKNGFKHFITICKHKSAVWYFGRKIGIGWRTFFHDFSKFHPIEFFESIKYYTGTRSPIDLCKEVNGYSMAWNHHKGHNPHHYEYWVDNLDKGGIPIKIPDKYIKEMFCDFLAAGYTYSKGNCTFSDEYKWWINKTSNPIAMHKDNIKFFDSIFSYLSTRFKDNKLKDLNRSEWKLIRIQINQLLSIENCI